MRVLLLFRGAAGCGKSSYIKQHNLEQYTLSADELRMRIQSPILYPDGSTGVSQRNDKEVWKVLFNLLEKRMTKGEFTVVDATNSKTSEMSRYKELADKYRYRIYIIDMTDLPIEECKRRNKLRDAHKIVPDASIEKQYSRFATQKIPSGITTIKPDELDKILYKPIDLSGYKKIHHIGDVHGCYTALMEYLVKAAEKDGYIQYSQKHATNVDGLVAYEVAMESLINPEHCYIFTGDYTDRGIENVELLKFLVNIYKFPNVFLLEGNHEVSLRNYASNIDDYNRNFKETTLAQLNKAVGTREIKKSDLRQLCRRFGQVCYYTYRDKKVLVCHGGLSGMKENLVYVSTEQIIRGVGEYGDYTQCAKAFEKNTDENTYQISGHRNVEGVNIHATDRCFNLERQVEFGGYLRVVTLDKNGFETHEIKNNVFREKEEPVEEVKEISEMTNEEIVKSLRESNFIDEKVMDNISSFNFTRDAFYKKQWDEQTITARGLFIDTRTNDIAARGYSKFFNINERDETKIMNLKSTLQFPVTAYVKENGFLGLISYNKDTDNLMFTTKSVVDYAAQEEDFVNTFKDLYMELTTDEQKQNLLDYVKANNKTVACECIHQQKDPHIIEYDSNRIYLLDIINNDFQGVKEPYDVLKDVANTFGLMCKEKAFTFDNWGDFYGWYLEVTDEDYEYNGRNIEGFVVEDSKGFMVKLKLAYYSFWKMMRGITYTVLKKGYLDKTSSLYNATSNYYYGWLKEHRDEFIYKDERGKVKFDDVNIIALRKRFLEDRMKGK